MPQLMDDDAHCRHVILMNFSNLGITAIMSWVSQCFSIQCGRGRVIKVKAVRPDAG